MRLKRFTEYCCKGQAVCYKINGDDIRRMGHSRSRIILNIFRDVFYEIFLPEGYPHSVSDDYFNYQFWDTIQVKKIWWQTWYNSNFSWQAFCSTICGILTTHAILKGYGVGNENATAMAATITWILKDGMGMLGRITFAWWKGSCLDSNCKTWRLMADFINDAAMCLELCLNSQMCSDHAPILLCVTSSMKSIVGVAGGATRAAITQHQAIRNNVADVSAKDGSQETCVNLMASFAGLFILTKINDDFSTAWIFFFLILVVVHLYANYKAVKSLNMRTFNAVRFSLFIDSYIKDDILATPKQINTLESPISALVSGNLRFMIGCSLENVIADKSVNMDRTLRDTACADQMDDFLIFFGKNTVYVILKRGVSDIDVIKSYFVAYCKSKYGSYSKSRHLSEIWSQLLKTGQDKFEKGWIFNRHQLPVGEWRADWKFDEQ